MSDRAPARARAHVGPTPAPALALALAPAPSPGGLGFLTAPRAGHTTTPEHQRRGHTHATRRSATTGTHDALVVCIIIDFILVLAANWSGLQFH